jgi:hypothetical protein
VELKVSDIKVTDQITDRAKTCVATLKPEDRVASPAAEFGFPGDSPNFSLTAIRPNGARLNVKTAYGGVPLHSIFSGSVEFMDDLEDANQYEYHLDLSSAPGNQAHRNRVSTIFNLSQSPDQRPTCTTAYYILAQVCSKAGLHLGRIDLPNHNVWGTYEVIRKNPMEVAEDLCSPFNQFEYLHYYVRVDEINGLQIIKIDYSLGGEIANCYNMPTPEKFGRSYERYMPDNRLGITDIFLTGADKYSNSAGGYITAQHTYRSDSRTKAASGTLTPALSGPTPEDVFPDNKGGAWAETITLMEFRCLATNQDGTTIPGVSGGDIDDLLTGVLSGAIYDLQILESYPIESTSNNYEDDKLTQTVKTTYTYSDMQFPYEAYEGGGSSHITLSEETLTTVYPSGQNYNTTLTKRQTLYSKTGQSIGEVTRTYDNDRGNWALELNGITIQHDTSAGLTNSLLQYYKYIRDQAGNHVIDTPNAQTAVSSQQSTTSINRSAITGRYQLLNGAPLPNLAPVDTLRERLRDQFAFHISVPYMDYWGLQLIWEICLRQKVLERSNVYWNNITSTSPLDTTPAAGESLAIEGYSGIVSKVEHSIDANSAVTSIELKRLV